MARMPTPREVVLDIVLRYAERMGKPNTVTFVTKRESPLGLVINAVNHLGSVVTLSCSAHLDGTPIVGHGVPTRYVLTKLGPTVWKLSPSVLDERLHAYITIVSVPEPAPWELLPS